MEFLQFTDKKYQATLTKWADEATKSDAFPHEVERRLQWIAESLCCQQVSTQKTIAYGVFKKSEDVAICTCELVLSDRGQLSGKWLKLLKITLSPEIDLLLTQEDFDAMQLAVNAYKTAVLGAFDARLEHDAATLKLYGRNDDQLQFLMTLLAMLKDSQASGLRAGREGRWLVLRTE